MGSARGDWPRAKGRTDLRTSLETPTDHGRHAIRQSREGPGRQVQRHAAQEEDGHQQATPLLERRLEQPHERSHREGHRPEQAARHPDERRGSETHRARGPHPPTSRTGKQSHVEGRADHTNVHGRGQVCRNPAQVPQQARGLHESPPERHNASGTRRPLLANGEGGHRRERVEAPEEGRPRPRFLALRALASRGTQTRSSARRSRRWPPDGCKEIRPPSWTTCSSSCG